MTKNGSTFIGRKEGIESGGLLGLGTRIMVENFHRIGKYESFKMELKIRERWIKAFLGRHLVKKKELKNCLAVLLFNWNNIQVKNSYK